MPAIHNLNGPIRIDPGRCGDGAVLAFVNTSPWPICDLTITTWDCEGILSEPEILPGRGFRIVLFDPITLPDGSTGVSNERKLEGGWNRSHSGELTTETIVVFEPGHCIAPGKGFELLIKFDETLDGKEGIEVSPSRLFGGEHYGIGGDVVDRNDCAETRARATRRVRRE